MIISMSVLYFFELRLCAALKVFLMSDVLVYGFPSFTLGVPTAHYASCTINHAKIKIFGDYYIVIPICINYFKNRTKTWSFVHPEPHSYPTSRPRFSPRAQKSSSVSEAAIIKPILSIIDFYLIHLDICIF